MKNFRMQTHAIRVAMLSAFVAGAAGAAMAQGIRPAGPPVVTVKPSGPPTDTKGSVKSNPKADKGQAKAEAARVAAQDRKETKSAFKAARHEHKSLNKGIKLTDSQKRAYRAVERRYDVELRSLEQGDKNARNDGEIDPMILARIHAARMNQRSLLRAELSPDQRIRFDLNVAALDGSK